ncbi:hypothetical protein H072_10973 [Dactylellina haptotyla CBS 200.50]|uniref:Peptidase C1A papain C-terminal domain-containing protein n=1 Tax=Dactylellina haptotyla (strain CBS 200.50) TaxID=1284197 RepID=S7ZXY7_DACHA|nr:hypothetical protein H072_10973 [Dactylellina haptotyla CBS 200.50]
MTAPAGGAMGGHAVVLVRCDDQSLTFMNSWGPGFANHGFFTIDRAATLEIDSRRQMKFFDVYWYTQDLSDAEVAAWEQHEKDTGSRFIGSLPASFYDLPVTCPHCHLVANASNYEGAWYEAVCRSCRRTFAPTVAELVRSLYENNYNPT